MHPSLTPAVEEALSEIATNNYCIIAALTLYVYDRCLSADQEAAHIWGRRFSTASALYILLHVIYLFTFMLEFTQSFVELDCRMYDAPSLIVAEAAQTTANLIVLVVTWRNTYRIYKLTRKTKLSAPLSVVLLRDGSLYFGLLLILNVLNIVFHYVDLSQGVSYFVALFTNMTVSHFFLNLRAASVSHDDSPSDASSTRSRFGFQPPQGVRSSRGSLFFARDVSVDDAEDMHGDERVETSDDCGADGLQEEVTDNMYAADIIAHV
ncbi:hypothetical protein FOMPIDRAFT_93217 [Fomitopsis schrenkii]|uniref:DUF6533 domain-containing protein n=1 Tax=Fomitopsis schrenkii TaxID=2126942 RepID=S8DJ69_FOMSC|nr:hypothetical protein FOMPIDRAFT_93217 [Fomitopsis schrenkii]